MRDDTQLRYSVKVAGLPGCSVHHPGHDDTEGVGEGQFIHLWQKKNGAWKIIRVISFDHHTAGK